MWINIAFFAILRMITFFTADVAADKKIGMVYKILPHEYSETHYSQYSESLTPEEARQVLAHMLGVSRFHKLGFQGQSTKILDKKEMLNEENLWKEMENHMIITLAGVIDYKMFYKQHPLFTIENSPSSEAYNYLIKRLLGQFNQLTGLSLEHLYGNMYGGGLFLIPPIMGIHDQIQHAPSLEMFEKIFDKKYSGIFDLQYKEDRCFLSEILSLDSFISALSNSSELSTNKLISAHLSSLEVLYHQYGIYSKQYTVASEATSFIINQISKKMPNTTFIVLLLPPKPIIKNTLIRRAEIENVFGDDHTAPSLKELRNIYPHCFSTKEDCEKLTNYCSNHGNCEKYLGQEECYTCQCFPTSTNTTGNGKKVFYWSGNLCQKRDISFEFQMFFWVHFFI
ncbi:hypothetical protein T552_00439 [Pneumocystis carinii B80]|uniref:Uncharacterized protein n=1 Tax=Pneumocystis carinii (strain B80) TaxID=1408658 RepID=A0A0W4ZQS9_PNEC8|nr:hypothetical protein T552_00439 [Pneumocystis carinii B80]KTW30727.1 hypothetical protein T552_00439 [Pneumocystis carinii B80]